MPPAEAHAAGTLRHVLLGGQEVPCRLVRAKGAGKLRIKVRGPDEIEVVLPECRDEDEGLAFVAANAAWVLNELERARRRLAIRRPEQCIRGQILLNGEAVPVRVSHLDSWQAPNRVVLRDGEIRITSGRGSSTPVVRSLENWLRKRARADIARHLEDLCPRVKRVPAKVYIMDQRTKWGNCSARGNLSFNWRLVMAPDYVLRYMVTHEVVHLAVPDHSRRFWLTVQGFCPSSERARQWLAANGQRLTQNLAELLPEDQPR